ncbi:outer membrane lipoprotein chaperone LolA [Porticoccus sp. W117]|uniref:outer membrane lipoprotein chaperone LolA n=1 Tax=Porticoccus sp. W117 TaxID=3054777 RepID=UPI002596108A|nr:outer membrane lipoprotein chaperone LolA [Porticoccus sp. W117]MDM3871949.1 outer membrane lipoprotein chaperone LolA [Porticoccus sp. W117]
MRLLTVAICCFFSAVAIAGGQPAAERLQALLSPIESMQGDFQQSQYDQAGERLQELDQNGQLQITRSGKIRWIVDGDYGQQLVSDGTTLWLFDPDLEQVTIQAVNNDASATPALLLMGNFEKLHASYRIQQGADDNAFTLYPRQPESLYQHINIRFSDGVPAALEITDNLGERTEITFQQVTVNPDLDDNQFVFAVPEGVDVIYN